MPPHGSCYSVIIIIIRFVYYVSLCSDYLLVWNKYLLAEQNLEERSWTFGLFSDCSESLIKIHRFFCALKKQENLKLWIYKIVYRLKYI